LLSAIPALAANLTLLSVLLLETFQQTLKTLPRCVPFGLPPDRVVRPQPGGNRFRSKMSLDWPTERILAICSVSYLKRKRVGKDVIRIHLPDDWQKRVLVRGVLPDASLTAGAISTFAYPNCTIEFEDRKRSRGDVFPDKVMSDDQRRDPDVTKGPEAR